MGRPIGTPLGRERVKLFVPEAWVLTSKGRRYVFLDAVQPKLFRLSNSIYNSNKLSARFSQLLHRDMYNTEVFYGLRAIDVDTPQGDLPISIELKITVGEGEDENEKISRV